MTPPEVRDNLIKALHLDLVGPTPADEAYLYEVIPQAPDIWYLTGFLVPQGANPDPVSDEKLEQEPKANRDDDPPERLAGPRPHFPSSMGLSVLLSADTQTLDLDLTWGEYQPQYEPEDQDNPKAREKNRIRAWQRVPCRAQVTLPVPEDPEPVSQALPDIKGLQVVVFARPVEANPERLPPGTRSASVFVVNQHAHPPQGTPACAHYVFQVQLTLTSPQPLVGRPDPREHLGDDWDERLADLQYRSDRELAVGHNVSVQVVGDQGDCRQVSTVWTPVAQVEKVVPAQVSGVELSMAALGQPDAPLTEQLQGMPREYRRWIQAQRSGLESLSNARLRTANQLLDQAEAVANRIQAGIATLRDPLVRDAFQTANRVVDRAIRQRLGPESPPSRWRPFQLAFFLMNLGGIVDPTNADRERVDLLFFPTGGGKTEAYLGLAAFTLVLRRLRQPGIASAGLSILMRYTLRLLTLDQLGRAATMICALELERKKDPERLGTWPFEIGLWVGDAATPNKLGKKGEPDPYKRTARSRVEEFKRSGKGAPIPLEQCPWCGEQLGKYSFLLHPNSNEPKELRITCLNRSCAFGGNSLLPVIAVDEQIYRRLPCFLIATADKFAALPWVGLTGGLFGRVDRHDVDGFYGPCNPNQGVSLPQGQLLPPDLIIQDELHLISGPLGTMAGLYEVAIEELATRGGIRPKIVASTATVRRAAEQIQGLFGRDQVEIFPPPGPDRRDSFFAKTVGAKETQPRVYLGIAAQGRSSKSVLLRTYLALLGAAQKAWEAKCSQYPNPADPYMTLVGYFNSLRELGGSRRIVEDEVTSRLSQYSTRRRLNDQESLFANRNLQAPHELTSRVPTHKVAQTKDKLAQEFSRPKSSGVDVVLATNMISVGLDITRLGLMVVLGQPKTTAEYIQSTSRVGRDDQRPGLVVNLLNIHRPRDRSHYEHFEAWHRTFYRAVESTSVTPFSPQALDRALAAVVVALARHGDPRLTPPGGALELMDVDRQDLEFIVSALARRVKSPALQAKLSQRVETILDAWKREAKDKGHGLQYQAGEGNTIGATSLLQDPLEHPEAQFKAQRSLRDVEPEVNILVNPYTTDSQTREETP